MSIADLVRDLGNANANKTNIDGNYEGGAPLGEYQPIHGTISVSEGSGTGRDGGYGVNFYNLDSQQNLQNGTYDVILHTDTNNTIQGVIGEGFWGPDMEDKIVNIKYNDPVEGMVSKTIHIGDNTSDAVRSYTIKPHRGMMVYEGQGAPGYNYEYPDYSTQNYFGAGQGTKNIYGFNLNPDGSSTQYEDPYGFADPYYTPEKYANETYGMDMYFSDMSGDKGSLPIVGNPNRWGDKFYNGWTNTFGGSAPSRFIGGLGEGLISGVGFLAGALPYTIAETARTGSSKPIEYLGSEVAASLLTMATLPIRAYTGEATDPWREAGGIASMFVGVKAPKIIKGGIAKSGDIYRTRNLPKLKESEYIHPDAIDASKPVFPAGKNYKDIQNSFESGEVITFTPDEISGNVVGGSRKGELGMEDTGIYVAPKGKGNPYFSRKGEYDGGGFWDEIEKGIEFKWNPFEYVKDAWNKYGKTGRVYETKAKVVEPPRAVLEEPGFSAVNKWGEENLVGTGDIRHTKRSMIGQGEIRRQKFKNEETGRMEWEGGTTEYEAVIPKGYEFKKTGAKGYIEYGGRRIIIEGFELITDDGKKITRYGDETGNILDETTLKHDINTHKPYYEDKYIIDADSYIINYIPKSNYPTNGSYPVNVSYPTKSNYPTNGSYPVNVSYPTEITTSSSTSLMVFPAIQLTTPYTSAEESEANNKGKRKKKKRIDNDKKKIIIKKSKNNMAKNKRKWHVNDMDVIAKSIEKELKKYDKMFK
jgi:hypothetical protein